MVLRDVRVALEDYVQQRVRLWHTLPPRGTDQQPGQPPMTTKKTLGGALQAMRKIIREDIAIVMDPAGTQLLQQQLEKLLRQLLNPDDQQR
jgi:hypothetical protein